MGPYQVLPLCARAGLGATAMKEYSAFPKAPALLESYLSAEVQSVYSTTLADLTKSIRSRSLCHSGLRTGQQHDKQSWTLVTLLHSLLD